MINIRVPRTVDAVLRIWERRVLNHSWDIWHLVLFSVDKIWLI